MRRGKGRVREGLVARYPTQTEMARGIVTNGKRSPE